MRTRIAAIAAAVVMLAVSTVPASADEWDSKVQPFDWGKPLLNSRTYVLNGHWLSDGSCSFEYPDVNISQDDLWWTVRVLAVDLDSCRELLEEGQAQQPPEVPRGKGYELATEHAPMPEGYRLPESALVSGTKIAKHVVQWVDPVLVAVNWVENDLTWSYDGDCAYYNDDLGKFDWLWQTGWQRVSWSVSTTHTTTCDWWQGQSRASYKNDIFCGLTTTWAIYDYVRVKGWSNGTATFSRSTALGGGCTGLLHVEFSTSVQSL